jgi:hypothetical protein
MSFTKESPGRKYPDQQFGLATGIPPSRHKVLDNLPGTPAFCPLVRRTATTEAQVAKGLDRRAREIAGKTQRDNEDTRGEYNDGIKFQAGIWD